MSQLDDMHEAIRDLSTQVANLRQEISETVPGTLTEEEHQWVRLAIQREGQSIKLRQAIIEKTLTGLIWAAIVGLGVILLDYLKAHGWKA